METNLELWKDERLYSLHKKKKIDYQLSKLIKFIYSELAVHIRWPNYWSFSFSIRLSNQYSGLISLKIDWFDLPLWAKNRCLWSVALEKTPENPLDSKEIKPVNACMCCVLAIQSCPALGTPWSIACQVPLSIGFFRQEYRSELPFPFPMRVHTLTNK